MHEKVFKVFKRNGWIWVSKFANDKVGTVVICPDVRGISSKEVLRKHLADQESYISRLTERVNIIKDILHAS